VSFADSRVTVSGDRTSIAHVGAALVRNGSVPPDLTVEVPNLEDALIELLEAGACSPQTTTDPNPIGAPS
jgi:hypothetical protein